MSYYKCLVLGGTGFIGRNLVSYLVNSGQCIVRSVDKVFPQTAYLSPEHAACYERTDVCQFMQGNLSSPASIQKCFAFEQEWDYVFNCAAETKYGQEEPIYTEKLHDVCIKIAQEAKKHPIKKFVHLSTAQVYEPSKKPAKESSKIDPWTVLAKSHYQTEKDLAAMGLPLVILRPAVVYGPGDIQGLAPRIICAAVYKYLNEKMKFLWTGELKLNTVHVWDVVRAMWHAAFSISPGATYNLADKNDTDQEKINKMLEEIFGIKTGFMGSTISAIGAKMSMKGLAENVNDKHLKPWADLCAQSNIVMTPLTPYLDPELLYNNNSCIDGTAIEATGFAYEIPKVDSNLLREVIQYYAAQNLFPIQ